LETAIGASSRDSPQIRQKTKVLKNALLKIHFAMVFGLSGMTEIPGDPRGFAKDMRCTVILEHPQSNCGVFGDGL
jgi:hypothetical protein